jgi:hypothetical protein
MTDTTYRDAHRRATRQLLLDEVGAARRPTRRVAFMAAGTVGLLAVGAGTAVAYQLATSAPVTDKTQLRCYSVASTDFGPHFPGVTIEAAPMWTPQSVPAHAVEVGPAVALCAYQWRVGIVRAPSSPSNSPGKYPVPPLVGCVLPDGAEAVFPNTSCHDLGLPVARSKPPG